MALCFCGRYIISSQFSRQTLPLNRRQGLFTSATYDLYSSSCPPKVFQFTTLKLPPHLKRSFWASISNQSSSASSSSMENPPQGYRRNVGICLMNPFSKKIFAASRLDILDAWQMPQGGIDESEDPRTAAIRELREETGVTAADIVAESGFFSNLLGKMMRSIFWVMALRRLNLENGHGIHQNK